MANMKLYEENKGMQKAENMKTYWMFRPVSCSPSSDRARLRATYTWPLAKGLAISVATTSRVMPCDLWMVIAYASISGICRGQVTLHV